MANLGDLYLGSTGRVQRYSADQPRDEHGRFGEGGGSAQAAVDATRTTYGRDQVAKHTSESGKGQLSVHQTAQLARPGDRVTYRGVDSRNRSLGERSFTVEGHSTTVNGGHKLIGRDAQLVSHQITTTGGHSEGLRFGGSGLNMARVDRITIHHQ